MPMTPSLSSACTTLIFAAKSFFRQCSRRVSEEPSLGHVGEASEIQYGAVQHGAGQLHSSLSCVEGREQGEKRSIFRHVDIIQVVISSEINPVLMVAKFCQTASFPDLVVSCTIDWYDVD
ncbi:uncharacterized protein PGTG_17728 [Puccinia graminis f. sp. tritici CRL 75-36-700-3]|uniref:Uncharacterized protein n=1 Tax=Puccinia graminis f. sp. tritici (strain CRL 75-36-700-3 / race SCCL) TaxID=418459 RepID=E3L4K3_PUCGT|nr:uncharacterized protein PGTG_17728 [Puccinia graminis f. sp. tritici CRL 75-36-700-3]EFP91478.1 hypothetical protein PGTG_17728 [Puccinia graminis f. sp. tritici CRL 75-36-700-3]